MEAIAKPVEYNSVDQHKGTVEEAILSGQGKDMKQCKTWFTLF